MTAVAQPEEEAVRAASRTSGDRPLEMRRRERATKGAHAPGGKSCAVLGAVTVTNRHRTATGHLDAVINTSDPAGALIAHELNGVRVRGHLAAIS